MLLKWLKVRRNWPDKQAGGSMYMYIYVCIVVKISLTAIELPVSHSIPTGIY